MTGATLIWTALTGQDRNVLGDYKWTGQCFSRKLRKTKRRIIIGQLYVFYNNFFISFLSGLEVERSAAMRMVVGSNLGCCIFFFAFFILFY